MGVVSEIESVARAEPELPDDMIETYLHYKKLRFGRANKDGAIALVARKPLTHSEIKSYCDLICENLEPWQINVIMDIDAIFEAR